MCGAALVLACLGGVTAWAAAPILSGERVDNISHSTARVVWAADQKTSMQVRFDTLAWWTSNGRYRYHTITSGGRGDTPRAFNLSGLAPATDYVAAPYSCNSNSECTLGRQVRFTTLPEPSPHPALPAPPDLHDFVTAYPPIDATLHVAADCSDLDSVIATAAGATYRNQTVKVVIPKGAVCATGNGRFLLKQKAGTGWIVLQSGGVLPAEGTRVAAEDAPEMATIRVDNANFGAFVDDDAGAPVHNYRFVGILFTHRAFGSESDIKTQLAPYLVQFSQPVYNMIFDRCYFRGRGYPDRLRGAYYGDGGQHHIAFLDSRFDNIDAWRAYQSGIEVSHQAPARNSYSGGRVYRGNGAVTVGAFSVTLAGTGSGAFRLYVSPDGAVTFKHNIATLNPTCSGCSVVYDAGLSVPDNCFKLMPADDGGNTAITGAQFRTASGLATGKTWDVQDGSDIGIWGGSIALNWEGQASKVLVRNNFIQANGFGLLAEMFHDSADDEPFQDFLVEKNTFQQNPKWLAHAPGDAEGVTVHRQHLEFKGCVRCKIDGNLFQTSFLGENGVPGAAIYISAPNGDNTYGIASSDITISNNLITDVASCIWVTGTNWNETDAHVNGLLRRVLIQNNACRSNAYTKHQWFLNHDTAPWGGHFRGMALQFVMGGEDFTVRHNTFYDQHGYQSAFKITDLWIEGLTVQDNIFTFNYDDWNYGLSSHRDYGSVDSEPPMASDREGRETLDGAVVRGPGNASWTFDHNVLVFGCKSARSCVDSTTDLVDVGRKLMLYPAGNVAPSGNTYGARLDAVGWINRSKDVFSLAASSPYKGAGTGGSDPGVDWSELMATVGVSGTASPPVLPADGPGVALLGVPFAFQFLAAGGTGTLTWTSTEPLPPGLQLDAGGLLSGTPEQAGSFPLGIAVVDSASLAASREYTLVVSPLSAPAIYVAGFPDTLGPAEQPPFDVRLGAAYPLPITGTLTLTFTPDAAFPDDPAIQFSSGGRTLRFAIPAGQTSAFPAFPPALQTGTSAGRIDLTLRFSVADLDITPSPPPVWSLVVPHSPPRIVSVQIADRTSSGFSVAIVGFSTLREVGQAAFSFNVASGADLYTVQLTLAVESAFAAWYGGPSSGQFGSSFYYTQPFTVPGDVEIVSVSVALSNEMGSSPPRRAESSAAVVACDGLNFRRAPLERIDLSSQPVPRLPLSW